MNNEPVAWMETYKGEPNNLDWDKSNLNYGSEFHDVVPLYTHPVNPYQSITNTKIEPTVVSYTHPVKEQDTDCQYCKQGCIRCDARKQLTDEEIGQLKGEWYRGNYASFYDLVIAILTKAQEK